jgi:hypothetical protein
VKKAGLRTEEVPQEPGLNDGKEGRVHIGSRRVGTPDHFRSMHRPQEPRSRRRNEVLRFRLVLGKDFSTNLCPHRQTSKTLRFALALRVPGTKRSDVVVEARKKEVRKEGRQEGRQVFEGSVPSFVPSFVSSFLPSFLLSLLPVLRLKQVQKLVKRSSK